jgi:tetratricopeptide (TPR) repeat protein
MTIAVFVALGCGKSSDDHMEEGYKLLRQGDTANAVLAFERAVEADPGNPEARNALGATLSSLGDFNRAVEHFRAAVAADSEFVEGRYNLARALAEMGLMDEALKEFKATAHLDPGYALAYMGAGDIFATMGSRDLAIESYRRAIAADSQLIVAYFRLATVYVSAGEYNKGIDLLLEARDIQPDNAEIVSLAGRSALAKRDYELAIELLEEAVEMDTLAVLYRNDLATALMLDERKDEAIEQWMWILERNPAPELEEIVRQNLERAREE